tara:strand:+ start:70 stop:786 length:717 start_codon:yes stop_codon:yes gene_type:complete
MKISSTRRAEIAKNLLQKYPKGGDRRRKMTRGNYATRYTWDTAADGYRNITRPAEEDDRFYRFDPIELFHCNWTCEWDTAKYITQLYPELGSSGVTQRSRRLVRRTAQAVSHLREIGTPGIYRISFSGPYGVDRELYDRHFRVFSNSKAEAETMAEMMLAPYFKYPGSRKFRKGTFSVTFVEPGDVTEALSLFTSFKDTTDHMVEQAEKKIARLKQKIENLKMQIDAVGTLTSGQMES